MTNTTTEGVKKAMPSQKPRRKSDVRKPKSRLRRRSSVSETASSSSSDSSGDEVDIAVMFFISLMQKQQVHEAIVWENFSNRLSEELRIKFKGHWYPETPDKGSGYRCIRVNSITPDWLVQRVAIDCGISTIRENLPAELTVWIDPGEVSYRIGEEGSICRHYYAEIPPTCPEIKKILSRPRSHSDLSVH